MAGFHADSSPEARVFNDRFVSETNAVGIKKLGAHHTDAQSYDAIHLFAKVMKEQNITGSKSNLESERLAIKGLKTVNF